MRQRGWVLVGLGLGLCVAAPRAARADDVTLNVPVRVENMAANVTRGRVECLVQATYSSVGPASASRTGRDVEAVNQRGYSSEFAIDTERGAYSGTQTVRVQVAPPRLWLDEGRAITVVRPAWTCHVQVATPTSDWYPSLSAPRDVATGQATGRRMEGEAPDWARSRGGNPIANGNLTVSGQPPSAR